MIHPDRTSNYSGYEYTLCETHDVFYLTGLADHPFTAQANTLPVLYGYIRRHRDEYILYICEGIFVNGDKKAISIYPLHDGDQLTVMTGCHMTFYLE